MVQQSLEVSQGLPADPRGLGHGHPVAEGPIKHPLRNFQSSATLLVLERAPQDRLAMPHKRVVDDD
jgi:hypothetical protein